MEAASIDSLEIFISPAQYFGIFKSFFNRIQSLAEQVIRPSFFIADVKEVHGQRILSDCRLAVLLDFKDYML